MSQILEQRLPSTWQELAARLDYSDLRVDTQERDLRLLCLEAEKFHLPAVVVNPVNVALAARFAGGTGVQVAAAVSYPVGAYAPEDKILEIQDAIADGADQIYMLMAVGAYRNGWIDTFTRPEIFGLAKTAESRPTRLIIEASILSDEEKRRLCQLSVEAGIGALVACTGFLPSKLPPVTPHDLAVLVETAAGRIPVYFMGEVENYSHAQELFECGVERLCTPSVRRLLAHFAGSPAKE